MRTDIDPFTQVLAALWDMFMDKSPVADLVKPGNRIHLAGGSKKPMKDKHSTRDLPQMYIYPAGGVLRLPMSSSSAGVEQNFAIQVNGGDLRVDRVFFPLKWAIVRVLCKKDEIMKSLGLEFVKNVLVSDYSETINIEKTPGWSATFTLTIQLVFSKEEVSYYQV